MYGKEHIENHLDIPLSEKFNIHKTRQNFGKDSIDTFGNMAQKGILIIDRVVKGALNRTINVAEDYWSIPNTTLNILPAND